MNQSVLFIGLMCSHTRMPSVGRFVWDGSAYGLVAASRQRPGSSLPAESRGQIQATFGTTPQYPGCPGCGASGFVRCGQCQNLSCWEEAWEVFHCPTCGNSGKVVGVIDRLSDLGTG